MGITVEYFIDVLEETKDIRLTCEKLGISKSYGYSLASKHKEEIQNRAKDRLTLASLKAVGVIEDSMSADNDTEKGELRLKAATEVLDRSGITKHTHVDVELGDGNALFIIPAKADVPSPEECTVIE